MRKAILCILLCLLAAPGFAGTVTCTNALVTAGYCRSTADTLIYFPIQTTQLQALVPQLAAAAGWTATVECTQAMVTAGTCTAGQLGAQVANPETQAQAASRAFRSAVVSLFQGVQRNAITAAKQAEADAAIQALAVPNVGN